MLIPCKANCTAHDVTRLFIKHWYPICGLPKLIVSDQDVKFTSHFWGTLFENFDTKLNFSSAFHSQSDGQTEIYNQIAFDVLKTYVHDHQAQWKHHLPLVQAILNDSYSSAIRRTPYRAAFRRPFQSLLTRAASQLPEANTESMSLAETIESVKFRLSKAQEFYSRQ